MELVVISKSVGRLGQNLAADVAKIAAALVAVGAERGGIFAPPLSIDGLGQAIKVFQDFHKLPVRDGRVDPGGGTLKKINAVLFGGLVPPPTPPQGTGKLKVIDAVAHSLSTSVNRPVNTPVEASLVRDLLFDWTVVTGGGRITYFELDEAIVPRWFGVLVPQGTTKFNNVHIFFHPTPGQAGFDDRQYHNLAAFKAIWHYLTDEMAAQFCAAATGRVLVMPLMTNGSAATAGVFPQRWESLVAKMLGMVSSGNLTDTAAPIGIDNVVVSSFSAGISYSHAFISRAKLGAKLKGIIDFDGAFSSFSGLSAGLAAGISPAVRMQQMVGVKQSQIAGLAARHFFPLPPTRWNKLLLVPAKDDRQSMNMIHGLIPQVTMFTAARRAG
jgi:hypothetical protein